MSDKLKKLTGKNPKDFEPVAFALVNNPDVELFKKLVECEDFLFDFVKENVSSRISKVVNESNYLNLLDFLEYYSPSYEECIVSCLAKFADEDLTDQMLEIFQNGTIAQKTYCAKFFLYIQDPLSLELLKENAYNQDLYLSSNCASTLAVMGDKELYNQAIEKLQSSDDFEQYNAVKFLCAYGNVEAVEQIIACAKKSSMSENISGELLYLTDFFTIFEKSKTDALFVLNSIINGLGEIIPISEVFNYRLYEILDSLKKYNSNSEVALVLLNSSDKFNTLTENDEYLFDETKDTKQEVFEIKKMLSKLDKDMLIKFAQQELTTDSLFINTALDLVCTKEKARELLHSSNQTVVLKSLEYLKTTGNLTQSDKNMALEVITNTNIRSIIFAM